MSEKIKFLQDVDTKEVELYAKTPLPEDKSNRVATTKWVKEQGFVKDGDEVNSLKIKNLKINSLHVGELSFDKIKIFDKNGNVFNFEKNEDGINLKLIEKIKDLTKWFTISDENNNKVFQIDEQNSFIKTSSFIMQIDDDGEKAEILNDLNFYPHFEGLKAIRTLWNSDERKLKIYLEVGETNTIKLIDDGILKGNLKYDSEHFTVDSNGLHLNLNFTDERYVNSEGDDYINGNFEVRGNLTVQGNTTLNGQKTEINSDSVEIKDSFVRINTLNANTSGFIFNDEGIAFYYDRQTGEFYFKYSDSEIEKVISDKNIYERLAAENPIEINVVDEQAVFKLKYNHLQFRLNENGELEISESYETMRYALNDLSNVDSKILLLKVKEVDGSGSGLDADLLDGHESTYFAVNDEVVHKTGDEEISGNKIFKDDVIVQGNLTVQGDLTSVQTTNLEIEDNVITLNKGEANGQVSSGIAGIEVDRSPSKPARLIFDESDDTWKLDFGDGNLYKIYTTKEPLNADTVDGYQASDFAFNDLRNVNDSIILNKLKNVDGHNSGLDADTLDGKHVSQLANVDLSNVEDNVLLTKIKNVDGSGSGLDADLLDGFHASDFAFADLRNVDDEVVRSKVNGFYLRRDMNTGPIENCQFNLGSESKMWKNFYACYHHGYEFNVINADLAEKYTVKGNPKPGDVVLISEDENYDGEISNEVASVRVLGIVSEKPGIILNKEENGIPIALKGKVKCKVKGPVKKGDVLVSYYNGYAIPLSLISENVSNYDKVGVALESTDKEEDYILVRV